MNDALARKAAAYQSFLGLVQSRDWELAAECQLVASAQFDAAMDAFVRACRAMEEGQRNA